MLAHALATRRRFAHPADQPAYRSRLMPETQLRVAERPPIKVGLFVTCLVDLFRPSVGFAALDLLERAGCVVEVPVGLFCRTARWSERAMTAIMAILTMR